MRAKVLSVLVLTAVGLGSTWTLVRATPPTQAATKSESALDQYVQLLRRDIRSQVKQLIAANLKLTDTEATKFWPVYDRYTADRVKINDQRYALIKEWADHWGTMTNDQALSLAKRSGALDEQIAQLRTMYLSTFSQVVPGTKVATFFQLDHRIQELIDLQLASQLPLVQEQYKRHGNGPKTEPRVEGRLGSAMRRDRIVKRADRGRIEQIAKELYPQVALLKQVKGVGTLICGDLHSDSG